MKGKKKYIMPLLLAGVTASSVVVDVQQNMTAIAAEKEEINTTNVQVSGGFRDGDGNVQSSFGVGKIYVPYISYNDNTPDTDYSECGEGKSYDFKVFKGSTELPDTVWGSDTKGKYFVADYEGYYTVKVIDLNAEEEYNVVHELKVLVEKEDAVINLPVNSVHVIPARVPSKLEGLPNTPAEIKVPAPTVTMDGEDEAVKVSTLGDDFKVSLISPSGTPTPLAWGDTDKTYYSIPKDLISEVGTYQIAYVLSKGTAVISRLETNFVVVNPSKFDLSDLNLSMSILSSVPTTGNINSKVKLPNVRVTDSPSSLDAINCHLAITVKNLTTKKVFEVTYEDGNYYFTPTEKGYYIVQYKASIGLFGEETVTVTPDQTIEVKDTEKPVLRPTYEYTTDEGTTVNGRTTKKILTVNGENVDTLYEAVKSTGITREDFVDKLLKNREVAIPSAVVLDQVDSNGANYANVVLPAIYATDNYDHFNEMTYRRVHVTPGSSINPIYTDKENQVDDYTKTYTAKITEPGLNKFRYKVTDSSGNTLGDITYEVMAYASKDELKDGKTTLDFVVGKKSVSNLDKTLTFDKPIVTDTYDKKVEVKTFYKLQTGSSFGSEIELTEDNINDDKKYEIDLTKLNNDVTGIQIIVKAYVDGALANTRTAFTGKDANKDIEVVFAESDIPLVNVLNSKNDTVAPVFSIDTSWESQLLSLNREYLYDYDEEHDTTAVLGINANGLATSDALATTPIDATLKIAPFDQGNDIITIPTVKFTDSYDKNMKISLTITDAEGSEVLKDTNETVTMDDTTPGSYIYTVEGAKLKLNSSGIYTVTFKAEDVGGNVTIKNFGIRVNDKTAPTIVISEESSFGKQIEVNDPYTFPTPKLIIKNGQTDNNASFKITVKALGGAKIKSQSKTEFTPASEGTFQIIYSATSSIGGMTTTIEDTSFCVTAKATKKPTIDIYENTAFPYLVSEFKKDTNKNFMTIKIPNASATDHQINDETDVTISISGPNGIKPEVKNDTTLASKYFEATAEGEYKVTYSAVSKFGVEADPIVKTIKLGDCDAPTIEWSNATETVELDKPLELYWSDLILDDGVKTDASVLEDNLSFTLTTQSGNTVERDVEASVEGQKYVWKMPETGKYTLTIKTKDGAKNESIKTYYIEVPEEEAEEETISPALGTVLVVLSVVVLAGVVVYFVASSKKKGKATRPSRKKK
ncbi:MAG: hypothetical protein E7345_01280 [Clostridiales bacterium]|nr:hypothetical protein [Clostridiales bacterium]